MVMALEAIVLRACHGKVAVQNRPVPASGLRPFHLNHRYAVLRQLFEVRFTQRLKEPLNRHSVIRFAACKPSSREPDESPAPPVHTGRAVLYPVFIFFFQGVDLFNAHKGEEFRKR